jgi:hypothetical protein
LQEEDNFDAERLDDVYERLAQIDADTAEARASAVLAGILLASGAQPAILLVSYARRKKFYWAVGLSQNIYSSVGLDQRIAHESNFVVVVFTVVAPCIPAISCFAAAHVAHAECTRNAGHGF